jgi:hypothetical protein
VIRFRHGFLAFEFIDSATFLIQIERRFQPPDLLRIVTGQFDPTRHRAVWPSTGNYCRGGVAISRIMQCRGVAVLPAGMSRERFAWLERWVTDPATSSGRPAW